MCPNGNVEVKCCEHIEGEEFYLIFKVEPWRKSKTSVVPDGLWDFVLELMGSGLALWQGETGLSLTWGGQEWLGMGSQDHPHLLSHIYMPRLMNALSYQWVSYLHTCARGNHWGTLGTRHARYNLCPKGMKEWLSAERLAPFQECHGHSQNCMAAFCRVGIVVMPIIQFRKLRHQKMI